MVRIFRHYIPKSLLVLGTGEAAIFFGLVYVGVSFWFSSFNPIDKLMVGSLWSKVAVFTLIMMLAMACMGLYQRSLREDLRGLLFRVGLALLLGLLILVVVFSWLPRFFFGHQGVTVAFTIAAGGIMIFPTLIYFFAGRILFDRDVLIIGSGETASKVEELRCKVNRWDMRLEGFLPLPGASALSQDSAERLSQSSDGTVDKLRQHEVRLKSMESTMASFANVMKDELALLRETTQQVVNSEREKKN